MPPFDGGWKRTPCRRRTWSGASTSSRRSRTCWPAGTELSFVTGEPGIVKSTLWEAGIGVARKRGFRVLATRTSSADARLAFAALIDLLDEVGGEVAVLRVEPVGHPPDERAIALGLLNVLRGCRRQ
jgi:hypothetical protein